MSKRRIAGIVVALVTVLTLPACASSRRSAAPSTTIAVTPPPDVPRSEAASPAATTAMSTSPPSTDDVAAPTTARRWIEAVEAIVRDVKPTPPEAARLYAYAAKAYDDARAAGSDEANAGAAVRLVLRAVRPDQTPAIEAAAQALGAADSIDLPRSSATKALVERAASDGFADAPVPTEPAGDGLWHSADGQAPLAPNAGGWAHWLLPTDARLTVPAPPVPGTAEHDRQLSIVKQAAALRDARWAERINFWGGTPGTNTPSGIWQDVLWSEVHDGSSALLRDEDYAHTQSILAQTIADAFIETWKVKYTYWTARPDMIDPTIKPAMRDPRFPGYVSGHSTISAAAATVLTALVPSKAPVWMADAVEARDSRLVAGIHLDIDNLEGFTLGTTIGRVIGDRIEGRPDKPATVVARPDRLAVPESIRTVLGNTPTTTPVPSPAGAPDSLAVTPTISARSPGARDGAGALVVVHKPGYERAFVVTLAGGATPQLGSGWQATTLSNDAMWTPAECEGIPTSLVGDRWIVYVETAGTTNGAQDVRLVSFDLSTKQFSSFLPLPNDESYDAVGTPVGDHEYDLSYWRDAIKDANGIPSGTPVVRRIDVRSGAYWDLPISGLGASNRPDGRWDPGELAVRYRIMHSTAGVTAEPWSASSATRSSVNGITQGDPVGDDVIYTRPDGAVHAKIHADRGAIVYGWAGTHGYFMAGNWSDDHRELTFAPGVYDVRSATWDWALTSREALFVVGLVANK